MRTTVTLEADVERELKEEARRTGEPFKQVINRVIRAGLRAGNVAQPTYEPLVFDLGPASVDLTQAAALAAQLEDDEWVRRYRQAR